MIDLSCVVRGAYCAVRIGKLPNLTGARAKTLYKGRNKVAVFVPAPPINYSGINPMDNLAET